MKTAIGSRRGMVAAVSVVAAVLSISGQSSAFSRLHASVCQPEANPANFVNYTNVSTTDTLRLGCPMTDTSVQPKNFFFSIRVDVRDNSAGASVSARRVTRSPGGVVSFGPTVSSGAAFTGNVSLFPPNFPAWAGNNYGYIQVFLPPDTAALPPSQIFGVSMLP